MFGKDMNAVSRELLAFFEEHKRSGKAIAALLRNYYEALAAQGNPNQQDVFGEQAAPDKQQLLERTIHDYEQEHGRNAGSGQLFERADERPAGEPVSETEPQPAGRRGDEAGAGENQGGTGRAHPATLRMQQKLMVEPSVCLLNTYDNKTETTPYTHWAREYLLRYGRQRKSLAD
ncbi:hypothetical protein [Eikenella longinqua]|uniref:hypothetical protein n=1 Tax=Eikenella longinqua TaxID=1795827 RepID=UPI0012E7F875|nr:hypothetical protein [Eikenella longinqua]